MLCVPNLGWLHAELCDLIHQWRALGMRYHAPINLKPNDHARNSCVKHFLASRAEYLFFVDHDTIPPWGAPLALLRAQKDVISGCTPTLKRDSDGELRKVYMVLREGVAPDGAAGLAPYMDSGIKPIDACGASCLMIHRRVLEMVRSPFRVLFDDDGLSVQGQDFTFCARARAAGVSIFADFGLRCKHVKDIGLE